MMTASAQRIAVFCGVGITFCFALLCLFRPLPFEYLTLKAYDVFERHYPLNKAVSDIVQIDIDERSVRRYGSWPWPTPVLSRLLDQIAHLKPKTIGLALPLTIPETPSAEGLDRLEQRLLDDHLQNLPEASPAVTQTIRNAFSAERHRLKGDAALADAVRRAGNVVLPVQAFADRPGVQPRMLPVDRPHPWRAQHLTEIRFLPTGDRPAVLPAESPVLSAASAAGPVYRLRDLDGGMRRSQAFFSIGDSLVPSYSLCVVSHFLDVPIKDIRIDASGRLAMNDRVMPLARNGSFRIRSAAPDARQQRLSAVDILAGGDRMAADLTGRVAMVTVSAAGAEPENETLSDPHGFPEIDLNSVRTLLAGTPIRMAEGAKLVEFITVLFVGSLATWVAVRFQRRVLFLAGAAIAFLLAAIGFSVFRFADWWQPLIVPGAQALLTPVLLALLCDAGDRLAIRQDVTRADLFSHLSGEPHLLAEKIGPLLYRLATAFERRQDWDNARRVHTFIRELTRQGRTKTALTQPPEGAANPVPTAKATGLGNGNRSHLGRYEIIRQIGKGAVGYVYLGRDPRINRTMAIKTIRFSEEMTSDELAVMKAKFFREAESAGALSHPRIVTIYDAGEDDALAYIAMEYLDGLSLKAFTRGAKRLPLAKVVGIGADIAEALDYAHRQGVIHRDVKPANIMLLKTGDIKLTDFGMARMISTSETQTGTIKGTPYYMSPEQFAGAPVDGRTDIFSLGISLFQLMTGEPPFRGDTPAKLMNAIMNLPHPDPRAFNPEIPSPVVSVLDRALEKLPERRYRRALHMAKHLRQIESALKSPAVTGPKRSSPGI